MGDDLRRKLTKLYGSEVRIVFEGESKDYVDALFNAGDLEKVLEQLYEGKRTELLDEIQRTSAKEVREIRKRTVYVGEIDPEELSNAKDYEDFFRILLHGTPRYQQKAQSFHMILSSIEIATLPEDLGDITGKMQSIFKGDASKKDIYWVVCTLRDDFISIGAQISYDRLFFMTTYLPELLSKKEDSRRVLLDKILNRTYPFTDDKKDEWRQEIREF